MDSVLVKLLSGIDGWQASAIALKAMTYGASFVASGGVFFLAWLSPRLSNPEQCSIRRVLAVAALAGMILSVSRIVVLNGMLSGEWSGMLDVEMTRAVLASREGPAIALRLAGLGLIGLGCGARISGWLLCIPLSGAVLAATSFSLAGHASELATEAGPLPLWLICVHLLAVAFWLGALWPLHRLTYSGDVGKIAAVMQRFGRMAAIFVGLLIAAGVLLLWLLLGTPGALWQSAYGQMMIVKFACVVFLLVLAVINKTRFTPRLYNGDRSAIAGLRRSIAAEIVVAGMILLTTASLTTITGPPAIN
jgi:putative copper export protein